MNFNEERPSKTQVKKNMNALQDLGMRLTEFASDTLLKAGLPEHIVKAAAEYHKITSNGALKRQAQYIGRLMREASDEEVAQIKNYLSIVDGDNAAHNAQMKRIEQWRDKLLAEDNNLTSYLNNYPNADANALRTLIRNARREAESSKPPKSARALFQQIKADIQNQAICVKDE
ncbi:MAG: DUF615 domain-containing protein [Neisseriaceae bacterium]|nr:DUF615 domain-containing protein [Neisseriaceae bacterium]